MFYNNLLTIPVLVGCTLLLEDWSHANLVKNFPAETRQNLIIGIISLAYEWPLKYLAGTSIHRSMEVRLMWLPLASLSSVLIYQATNPALYYLIGVVVYFWAYSEGEVSRDLPDSQNILLTFAIRSYVRYHGHYRNEPTDEESRKHDCYDFHF